MNALEKFFSSFRSKESKDNDYQPGIRIRSTVKPEEQLSKNDVFENANRELNKVWMLDKTKGQEAKIKSIQIVIGYE